jgi:hypothetical protein
MIFMWLLIAIVLVAIMCAGHELVQRWKPGVPGRAIPLRSSREVIPATSKRHAKWISMAECERLLHSNRNVFFVVIRSYGVSGPLPFWGIHAVSISPGEIVDVLQWIPTHDIVVFCGETDVCSSLFERREDGVGTASIYILNRQLIQAKAGRIESTLVEPSMSIKSYGI